MRRIVLFLSIFSLYLGASCANQQQKETISFVQPTAYPSSQVADYFPLATGAYWIYQGTVKWTRPNSTASDVVEQAIQWKMEVMRQIEDNDIVGYEMQGAPWDLAWYEEGQEPSKYAIIRVGTARFYQTSVDTMLRLLDQNEALRALVNGDDLLLDIPLITGKKFCGDFSIARPDGMYCWNVGKVAQADLKNVRGIDTSEPLDEYPIFQATGPDFSGFTFVPGVGITSYTYQHHGTISECDIRLIEFHPGH
jgi:hypothetical protein